MRNGSLVVLFFLLAFAAAGLSQTPTPNETFQQLSEQARRAQRDGQSKEAIRLYLKALEVRPEWADGWRNVGLLLADLKDYPRAEIAFKNALKNDPRDGNSWAMLGMVEFQEGRTDDAYGDLQRGRTLGVHNADLENVANYHVAAIMIAKGEFEAARPVLQRLARSGVDDPEVILAFGLAALRLPVVPEKLEESRKPLVLRVGQIEYRAVHALVPETIQVYKQLVAEFPQAPGLHYAFGNYLIDQAHYDEGLAEMQKELELNPKDVMAELQMAMTYLKLSQPEKALSVAEDAARLRPDFFASRYALGWTLYRLGQNDRAITELEMAVKLEPKNARIHFALSQAYQRAHRREEAERERAIFAKMKQFEPPAPGSVPPREYTGSPDRNLPTPPQG
jgi:tetratricopeptide (TPR) repeat protein